MLKGNSVVAARGITLDDLAAEASALDTVGVGGAAELADLIGQTRQAEPPLVIED